MLLKGIANFFGYVRKKATRIFRLNSMDIGGTDLGRAHPENYKNYLQQYADSAWVYSCIYQIASKAAGVPYRLKKQKMSKGVVSEEEVGDDKLINLLYTPNPWMSGYDLIEATISFMELTGNAYWLLDSMVAGKPTEMWYLPPDSVRIVPDDNNFIKGYTYDPGDGKPFFIEKEFIIHFKYFNPLDMYYGMGPLSPGRKSIDSQNYGDEYNREFFKGGAEPGVTLITDGELDDDQRLRIKAAWKAKHRGYKNAHRTALLEGGMKIERTGIGHKDMDFVNLKKMSREDILGVLKMPPAMVGIFEYANYANSVEQRKIFWIDTMMPKIRKFVSTLDSFLVAPYHDTTYFLDPDYSGIEVLQKDKKQQAEIDDIQVKNGTKLINEIRERDGDDPLPYGNTWNAPMNLMPISEDRPEKGGGDTGTDDEKTAYKVKANYNFFEDETVVAAKERAEDIYNQYKDRGEIKGDIDEREMAYREKVREFFRRFSEKYARIFRAPYREAFTRQEKETIRRLRKHGIKYKEDKTITKNNNIDMVMYPRAEEEQLMAKMTALLLSKVMVDKAKHEIDELGLDISFDVHNPEVAKWIKKNSFEYVREVSKTTRKKLRKELEEAFEEGESIRDIEKRIAKVFDEARGYRTQRIAITESNAASNAGSFNAYKQSGVVEGKTWLVSGLGNTRDLHQIDGETVPLDQPFSNGLMFPGDPSGSPENIINCHCTIKGKVKAEE